MRTFLLSSSSYSLFFCTFDDSTKFVKMRNNNKNHFGLKVQNRKHCVKHTWARTRTKIGILTLKHMRKRSSTLCCTRARSELRAYVLCICYSLSSSLALSEKHEKEKETSIHWTNCEKKHTSSRQCMISLWSMPTTAKVLVCQVQLGSIYVYVMIFLYT